jgi:hypothetical protein
MITKISPNQLMLQSTIKNKRFSLQFLPQKFESISKLKKIQYQNKNLKPSFLIDIVHNLILKYYFKRENLFNLNATILKEKYGHLYNFYIKYLLDNNILELKKNYLKGKNSRVYSLCNDILTDKIGRYRNSDKILLKKYVNRYYQFEIDNNDLISPDIKDKLILDLYSVKIEYEKSIFFLTSLKDEDISIYNRNRYSVESINENHIFYHFDHFGRMHSNYTILKTFLRKNCLLIGGEETCEIDIKNSQPLFLSKLIKDIESRWVNKDELDLFTILVRNGNYYQYLIDNLGLKDKSEAKEMTYKVFFGKNHQNSKWDNMFKDLFPTIHHFIKLYKREHNDYKVLAYTLQRMESKLIFEDIIRTIMIINPDIKIVTVHDSIIVQRRWRDFVTSIFDSKLTENFEK